MDIEVSMTTKEGPDVPLMKEDTIEFIPIPTYHARFLEPLSMSKIYEEGNSIEEAIGNLIKKHGKRIGIDIHWIGRT